MNAVLYKTLKRGKTGRKVVATADKPVCAYNSKRTDGQFVGFRFTNEQLETYHVEFPKVELEDVVRPPVDVPKVRYELVDMTDKDRCEIIIARLGYYLRSVFGQIIDLDWNKNENTVLVDGWLEIMPTSITEEAVGGRKVPVPAWSLCELHTIPQTRWEPEDVDVKEVGTYRFNELLKVLVDRMVDARLSNAGECEWEADEPNGNDLVGS